MPSPIARTAALQQTNSNAVNWLSPETELALALLEGKVAAQEFEYPEEKTITLYLLKSLREILSDCKLTEPTRALKADLGNLDLF